MTTTGLAFVDTVRDGDSFHCLPDGEVRLVDVCAPETGQPGSALAKQRLEALILRNNVALRRVARDVYGRLLAEVYVGFTHVNEAQRNNGYRCR